MQEYPTRIGTYLVSRERVPPRAAAASLLTLGGVVRVARFPVTGNADVQPTPAAVVLAARER
ncbi:MAG: hypothetical protein ACOVSI_08870 [Gemmatimonas sp.]|jgi:hypothetical protein